MRPSVFRVLQHVAPVERLSAIKIARALISPWRRRMPTGTRCASSPPPPPSPPTPNTQHPTPTAQHPTPLQCNVRQLIGLSQIFSEDSVVVALIVVGGGLRTGGGQRGAFDFPTLVRPNIYKPRGRCSRSDKRPLRFDLICTSGPVAPGAWAFP
jgi:hypothetical protein